MLPPASFVGKFQSSFSHYTGHHHVPFIVPAHTTTNYSRNNPLDRLMRSANERTIYQYYYLYLYYHCNYVLSVVKRMFCSRSPMDLCSPRSDIRRTYSSHTQLRGVRGCGHNRTAVPPQLREYKSCGGCGYTYAEHTFYYYFYLIQMRMCVICIDYLNCILCFKLMYRAR